MDNQKYTVLMLNNLFNYKHFEHIFCINFALETNKNVVWYTGHIQAEDALGIC